ncbi:hypothetical protein O181_063914 [Austropuccinia psidii MF-1]|uniref:Uncharacterized protein n=1 Tax=Austropuccinia psidii MF-1 TaxID=1389203 RepID=A0A9Q3I310_9BASI|nr:hypothetical protein [Austropuccinia psidii MF-1]
MTMEAYELLKETNINNCGTLEVGMELGNFPQTNVEDYGSIPQDDMVVPMEGLCEQGGHSGSEIAETLPREVMSDWPEDQPNMPSQPEGIQETHHGATPLHIGCWDSVSQSSSMSTQTTRRDCNFMNNMNTNMQNFLLPLMLMLQQSQDWAEEQHQMQKSQDDKRQMLMCEQEEEHCLWKTQIHAEEH